MRSTRSTRAATNAATAAPARVSLDAAENMGTDGGTSVLSRLAAEGKATDFWMIVPFPGMNNDCSLKEYGHWLKSDHVLSSWIGVDGEKFADLLFKDKKRNVKRETYLTKKFGVKVVDVRTRFVVMNFNTDAARYDKSVHSGPRPDFSLEPIEKAKEALQSAELSTEVIHDFINNLRKHSILHHVLPITRVLDDVGMTHGISARLEADNIESSSQGHDVVEANDSEVARLAVDTESGGGTNATLPLVSPSPKKVETADAKIQTERPEDPLAHGLQIAWPRKSIPTIQQMSDSDSLEWTSSERRSKAPSKEAKDIHCVVHAACSQNSNTGGWALHTMLRKDPLLEIALFSHYTSSQLKEKAPIKELLDGHNKTDTLIVEGINTFSDLIFSRGSKYLPEQQAQNAIRTASVCAAASTEEHTAIKNRLNMTDKALNKAVSRAATMIEKKASSTEHVQVYEHDVRATRRDCKLHPAAIYVYRFCHKETYDRVSRLDTGEFKFVRVMDVSTGKMESHPIRRIEEQYNGSYLRMFEHYQQSEEAKQFKQDYPHLESIGFKIFKQLLCPCCRYATNEMCSDEVMSQLEEARAGYQRGMTLKEFKDAIKTCQCPFHRDKTASQLLLKRAEDIIEDTLCPRKEMPDLTINPYLGYESKSKPVVPKLHDFKCINGNCSSCGVQKSVFSLMEECPLLCPPVVDDDDNDDDNDDDDDDDDDEDDKEGEDDTDIDPVVFVGDEDEATAIQSMNISHGLCAANDFCGMKSIPLDNPPQHHCIVCKGGMHGGLCGKLWEEDIANDQTYEDPKSDLDDDAQNQINPHTLVCHHCIEYKLIRSTVATTTTATAPSAAANTCENAGCNDAVESNTAETVTTEDNIVVADSSATKPTHSEMTAASPNATEASDVSEETAAPNATEADNVSEETAAPNATEASDVSEETAAPNASETRTRWGTVGGGLVLAPLAASLAALQLSVKAWDLRPVERTDRKQKVLVQKKMTMPELIKHLKESTEKARGHYVWYKYVDLQMDRLIHNTKPEDRRIVIKADYSANPNLQGKRTACGHIDSHAAMEIFIVYEYTKVSETNEAGETVVRDVCIKRSHVFIGSAETAGKKNDWQFHIACAKRLVEEYQSKRSESDYIKEVVFLTDRCPSQYLCRQNFLQVAKASSGDGSPTYVHMFAVKSRFKGEHDAEGKIIKLGIREWVLRGDEGATAWEAFETVKSRLEKKDMNTAKEPNKLDERRIYFVVYDIDEKRMKSEVYGEDIVFADMDIQDDTDAVSATNKIYVIEGMKNFIISCLEELIDFAEVRDELYELDKHDDDEDDDEFLATFNQKGDVTASECARYDFIRIDRGLEDQDQGFKLVETSLDKKTSKYEREYLDEFLRRCGRDKPPQDVRAKWKRVDGWIHKSKVDRIYAERTTNKLQEWWKERFPEADEQPPSGKRRILGDILGVELPKYPSPKKKAGQLYREEKYAQKKKLHPNYSVQQLNAELRHEFEALDEARKWVWDQKELKDKERYEKEMLQYNVGGDDEVIFWAKRYNLPCWCDSHLRGNPNQCTCLFKGMRREKTLRFKQKQRQREESDDQNEEDREEN